ncbi:hypothetical protein BC832DRAFT_547285 [Gaertneriomyces semiglobifer]|nr:hypothetical protein BC832DRAFT_547285 [Gaertneriomyces semiglobifer]
MLQSGPSLFLVLILLLLPSPPSQSSSSAIGSFVLAANTTLFCKCICQPNVTVLTVEACSRCTKDLCVEVGACFRLPPPNTDDGGITATATKTLEESPSEGEPALPQPTTPTGDEDWIVRCYQLGSYKDEFIVYSFITVVLALLGWAAAKPYTERRANNVRLRTSSEAVH